MPEQYHRVAEEYPDGTVRTLGGLQIAKRRVYGPGENPCPVCMRQENQPTWTSRT